jgi:hypothetical protein
MQSSFLRKFVLAHLAAAVLSATATVAQVEKTPKPTAPLNSNADPKADQSDKQKPGLNVTISKETTFITEPLREDGYPDYVRYIEERLRKGATSENNATVLLLRVFGPREISEQHRSEFFKRLGIEPLPAEGDYLVDWATYSQRFSSKDWLPVPAGLQQTGREYFESLDIVAGERPWTAKDFPALADWLRAHDKHIDQLVAASKRPRMYSPLITSDEAQTLVAMLLPVAQNNRQAARALVTRAMYRAGNGDFEAAVEDLVACQRLARLSAQGFSLIESLIGLAMNQMALHAEATLVAEDKWTASQRAMLRKQLEQLPPMRSMADAIDQGERLVYVDIVSRMARGLTRAIEELGQGKFSAIEHAMSDATVGRAMDWDIVLKTGNEWYDRVVAIAGIADRKEQLKRFRKFDQDLKALAQAPSSPKLVFGAILAPRATVSQQFANRLLLVLLPAMGAAIDAERRNETIQGLVTLGLALADYRDEHKRFPDTLDQLAPKYLDKVPLDSMWGEPFVYKKVDEGYVLYGRGRNGQDDGGSISDSGDGPEDLVIAVRRKR